MIVGSLLLILVAVTLLILGLVGGSSGLLTSSIVVSLLAAIALVIGARQAAGARRGVTPEPLAVDLDDDPGPVPPVEETAAWAQPTDPATTSGDTRSRSADDLPSDGSLSGDPAAAETVVGPGHTHPAAADTEVFARDLDLASDTEPINAADAQRGVRSAPSGGPEHGIEHDRVGHGDGPAGERHGPSGGAGRSDFDLFGNDRSDDGSAHAEAEDPYADFHREHPAAAPLGPDRDHPDSWLRALDEEHAQAEAARAAEARDAGARDFGGFEAASGDPAQELPPDDEDPADEPPPQRVQPADAVRVSQMIAEVLVVDGRPRYHLGDCATLDGRTTEPLPVSEAVELGFTSCSMCRPADRLVAEAAHR